MKSGYPFEANHLFVETMSESCSKSISHLLAAATYIDEEVKKPKTGRKSVISFINTSNIEDMELMFDEDDNSDKKVYVSEKRVSPQQRPDEDEDDDNSNDGTGGKHRRSFNERLNHKDLEKHRRAHLRGCLEQLKELVPLGPDVQKHTTLGLLRKTRYVLRCLEDKERRLSVFKEQLKKENAYLKRKLEQAQQIPQVGANQFSMSAATFSTSTAGLSSAAKPHILRKRSTPIHDANYGYIIPQTIIPPQQGNQSENFCLLIDDVELTETPGYSGGGDGGIPIKFEQSIDNNDGGSLTMILCNGNYSPSTHRFTLTGINK